MKAWGRVAVAAALISCALPGAAAAAPKHEVQRPTASALIDLPRSQGYFPVLTIPNERVAAFYLDRNFDAGFAYAAYIVNRRPSDPSRLSFALGSLGHVSLRFVPSGKRRVHRTPSRGCRGRPSVTIEGEFRGRLGFRGEGGYLKVRATRAQGEILRSFRLVCKAGKADHSYAGRSLRQYWSFPTEFGEIGVDSSLLAAADAGGRTVEFQAKRVFESETPEFVAATQEWLGRMLVGHAAFVNGERTDSFASSEPGQHPATATVRPPAPFHGEASFFETSQTSHSWTGAFSVSFPGLKLPLTGPEFATSLCRLDLDKSPWGCDAYESKPVVPARPSVQDLAARR